jgi:hypothetical protein
VAIFSKKVFQSWEKGGVKMCKVCNRKRCSSILAAFFIIIALALAIATSFWRQQTFLATVSISHFFDIMLPTLGVGALIKYLFTHHCCCGTCPHCRHTCQEEAEAQKKPVA